MKFTQKACKITLPKTKSANARSWLYPFPPCPKSSITSPLAFSLPVAVVVVVGEMMLDVLCRAGVFAGELVCIRRDAVRTN